MAIATEQELAGLALELGVSAVALSSDERRLAVMATQPPRALVENARARIEQGEDPLGAALCRLRSPAQRRPAGATYTPSPIVDAMVSWAELRGAPKRIIDPGAGSGRYLVAAGKRFPSATLVAVETDPLAALLTRANLEVAGLSARAEVVVEDYRTVALPRIVGKTLYIGNPPYVRHHLLGPTWKTWLADTAAKHGISSSKLAGLHVHFFLATAEKAVEGDLGAFITAAEWLDVNYGRLVRELFVGPLGGTDIHLLEPTTQPFADAQTTAAIACFEVGTRAPSVGMRRVSSLAELGALPTTTHVHRERLASATRWTPLTRATKTTPSDFVELGELCRVHRGQVTGSNRIFISPSFRDDLPPSVQFPSVTKARELFGAGEALTDVSRLRCVVDIPTDLETLNEHERTQVERFLHFARELGADRSFTATHRKAWWSVGLKAPAPILATYMARRPPAFVRNLVGVRHINIAHGVYPREPLSHHALDALARYLASAVTLVEGRTYAGGLTKFEPKEMERLLVPRPTELSSGWC
jgi:hypothetical protein